MKIYKSILIGIVVTIVFSGCTNNNSLTIAQIDNIKSISVHKPKVLNTFTIEESIRTSEVQDSVGMAGGGFLPSLIGALIDEGIHSYKQNKFENKYKDSLDKIKEYQIENIDAKIELKILSVLEKDNFLSKRIVNDSTTFFDAKINSFGLRRRFIDQNDEVYLGAHLNLVVSLIGEDGKLIVNGKYIPIYSKDSYSVSKLAEDNTLVEKLFDEIYDNFEQEFNNYVNEVFKNKKI